MRDRASRILPGVAVLLGCSFCLYLAYSRPGYFSDPRMLGTLIFLQGLALIIFKYREAFFPALIMVFLLGGSAAPLHEVWTSIRWLVLGAGAVFGLPLYFKDHDRPFGVFHFAAFGCALTAMVSALVSAYPEVALLKALSLFLLFLYAAAGARVAVAGREQQFFSGLVLGCEILVYLSAIAYLGLHFEAFGNRNSLGVAMGVVALPILLWGLLVSDGSAARCRRILALVLCQLLLLSSYERAGIVAAIVSSTLLCVGLRRYRVLLAGLVIALVTAAALDAFVPLRATPDSGDGSLASRFVYKGKRENGLLGSRKSVWEQTLSSLQQHPRFGTGFGTSATAYDKTQVSERFSSAGQVTREHGNSYLEIAEWVGFVGAVPFLLLLLLMVAKVGQVFCWVRRTASPFAPAVPLAAFVAGALVHAGFEDWLFAVGYHTCVLFWALAFLLPDYLPIENPTRIRTLETRHPSSLPNNSFQTVAPVSG
jgi:O-antigen ligase